MEGGKKGGRGSARKEYFVIREGFSPVKMVTGNPMVLVALFSLVMVVGVPKVMDKCKCPGERQRAPRVYPCRRGDDG